MQFTEVLSKNGLTADTVSAGLKAQIKRYDKLFAAVEEAKAKLPNVKTESAKKNLEKEITTGEENLASMNTELCTKIQAHADNKELNAKKAENLKNARDKRNTGTQGAAGSSTPASEEKPEEKPKEEKPAANNKPAEEKKNEKPAKQEHVEVTAEEEKPKKKSNVAAIIGGAIVLGVLGFLGFNAYKNSKSE